MEDSGQHPQQRKKNSFFVDERAVLESDMEDSGQHPQQRKKNRHHRHTDCKQGLIL